MDNLRFHVMPDSGISAVVLHRNHHPLYGLTRENVYPEEPQHAFIDLITALRGRSPQSRCLPSPRAFDCLYWQQNLHIEERNGQYLIFDPDSGGLMVLDERMWRLFRLMEQPVPYRYIIHNYLAPAETTDSFIEECRSRHLLCLESSPAIFENPGDETPSVCVSIALGLSLPGRWTESSQSPCNKALLDKLLRETLPEKVGATPLVEIFSENSERDREFLLSLITHLRSARGYENSAVLIHMPLETADIAQSACWAWKGVMARVYSSSNEEFMDSRSPSSEKLDILVENQVLESLSVVVKNNRDLEVIKALIERESVPEVRVTPGNLRIEGPDPAMGQGSAEEMAEALLDLLEKLPIEARFRVFPINYIFERLIHSRFTSPCMQRGLQYSSARVLLNCGNAVIICESPGEKGTSSDSRFTEDCYRHDRWQCTSIGKECVQCRWRKICPGQCTAMAKWSGKATEKSLCDFYRVLIPELLTRSWLSGMA